MTDKTKTLVKQWLFERASEPTTWVGIITVLGSFGLFALDESVMMGYVSVLTLLAGVFSIIWKEERKIKKPHSSKKKKIKSKTTVDYSDDPTEIMVDDEEL